MIPTYTVRTLNGPMLSFLRFPNLVLLVIQLTMATTLRETIVDDDLERYDAAEAAITDDMPSGMELQDQQVVLIVHDADSGDVVAEHRFGANDAAAAYFEEQKQKFADLDGGEGPNIHEKRLNCARDNAEDSSQLDARTCCSKRSLSGRRRLSSRGAPRATNFVVMACTA